MAGDRGFTTTVAATFTAEPLGSALRFWLDALDIPNDLAFTPYNQVFQALLDPAGPMAGNERGVNLLLVRLEDWLAEPFNRQAVAADEEHVVDRADTVAGGLSSARLDDAASRQMVQFARAVRGAAGRSRVPYTIIMCPPSPAARLYPSWDRVSASAEQLLRTELADVPGVTLYTSEHVVALYPDAAECDGTAERLGSVPYTPLAFTALGTLAARAVYAASRPAHKVIVVDGDNTLWKGVCAEDGPSGVSLEGAHLVLQSFLIEQHGRGRLVCLCSKNDEADVFAVFRSRDDFLLQTHHLAAWRVSWEPKSVSLRVLAQQLNVSLDSVVFIDDNPLECFEVAAACPDATVVQLPGDEIAARRMLNHLWCLDSRPITSEDRRRGAMYREQAQRVEYQREVASFEAFIDGLQLQVSITPIEAGEVARAAQLTERTTQFNFTTIQRSEGDIRHAIATGALHWWGVTVSDRFGEYGLVGLLGFAVEGQAIAVDTFLLSCRVLGRGVEHRMLAALGQAALDRRIQRVEIPWVRTNRNTPVLRFAEEIGSRPSSNGGGASGAISLDAAVAAGVKFVPRGAETLQAPLDVAEAGRSARTDPRVLAAIAQELRDPRDVLRRMTGETGSPVTPDQQTRPDDVIEVVRRIWAECLARPVTSLSDSFFDLGGTSVTAVQVAARLVREFGLDFSLADVLSRPTVQALGEFVSRSKETRTRSAIPRLPRRIGKAEAGSSRASQSDTHG